MNLSEIGLATVQYACSMSSVQLALSVTPLILKCSLLSEWLKIIGEFKSIIGKEAVGQPK